MPNIRLREIDNTLASSNAEVNDFAVLVSGAGNEEYDAQSYTDIDYFNTHHLYEDSELSVITEEPEQITTALIGKLWVDTTGAGTTYKRCVNVITVDEDLEAVWEVITVKDSRPEKITKNMLNKVVYKVVGSTSTKYYTIIENESIDTYMHNIVKNIIKSGLEVIYAVTPIIVDEAELTDKDYAFWERFEDKDLYNFMFVIGSKQEEDADKKLVNENILKLCATRGDAVAIVDTQKNKHTEVKLVIDALSEEFITRWDNYSESTLAYGTSFAPDLVIDKNPTEIISSLGYMNAFGRQLSKGNKYEATAGSTRGMMSLNSVETLSKYGQKIINELQKRSEANFRAINPIATLGKQSPLIYGARTLLPIETELKASHFLNIRINCNLIKKLVYRTCRKLMFEPNTDTLYIRFMNEISPLLDDMQSKGAIAGYEFKREATSVRAKMNVRIIIKPIEPVEDFDITLELTDENITIE